MMEVLDCLCRELLIVFGCEENADFDGLHSSLVLKQGLAKIHENNLKNVRMNCAWEN